MVEWLPQIVIFRTSVTGAPSFCGDLGDGAVVVEAGHRREPAGVEVLGVGLGDQGVGVGRVADDEDLDVALGAARQRLALRLEDAAVRRQQVGALHARLARHRADEQGDVGVAERDVGVVGAHDLGQQREGAVVELHLHALERAERRRDLEQLEDDGGVRAEHRAGGDAEQQAVADLAGGPGDGDADGSADVMVAERRPAPPPRRIQGGSGPARRAQMPSWSKISWA